ncbi:DNA polymerase III subunit beta [Candidatus Karelsulcia muelleri]|uniref:DNA polymerase III subunit beta n=1 Tax=Candidatus Karelsulcia muelleri TaxID=336810 RepID=UPI001FF2A250|nr:DNA polymerase III subunit beta [Candidatus Karelsulcia muelleri]UOQ27676.1 DNA polymerase III subunit beta [Candidatus Karelsulcia muelleri]
MNFSINCHYLFKSLKSIYSVINQNHHISIFTCFILNVKNNMLKIKASDSEISIKTTLKVFSKQKGKAAVPAKLLMDILKHIPEQPLKIKKRNFNQIRIISFKGNYDISLLNHELFPKYKKRKRTQVCVLNKKTIINIIDNTLFAVGNDDLRPVINGVCFEIKKKKGIFVATNNNILAKYSINSINTKAEMKFIIPKKTLLVLKKNFNNKTNIIKIQYNKYNTYFIFTNNIIITSLIKGKFPNYKKILPLYNKKNKLRIARKEFKTSIKRINLFSNKIDNKINFSLSKNKSIIYAENKDSSNKGYEELVCKYFGENLEISFKYNDLIEGLYNLKCEEIEIKLQERYSPALIRPISSLETEKSFRLIVPLS